LDIEEKKKKMELQGMDIAGKGQEELGSRNSRLIDSWGRCKEVEGGGYNDIQDTC
jgi:hypothetical protein